jgi:DNA adenine methylase
MTKSRRLSICKYPGGKSKIVSWVLRRFPGHDRYVEAFAGSASVLLNKPPCRSEFLIERDPMQANLLRVARDRTAEIVARLSRMPHRRDAFVEARERLRRGEWADDIDLAVLAYVRRQMSWAGEGKTYSYRSRRDLDSWWASRLARLPLVGDRLRGVEIIEGDALEWIPLLDHGQRA